MNKEIIRTLKSQEQDNKLLDREIERMQKIDRAKVQHARNSFFVPEVGSMIPSLDHFPASRSTMPSYPDHLSGGVASGGAEEHHVTMPSSSRAMVTANEVSGICERLSRREGTGAPS